MAFSWANYSIGIPDADFLLLNNGVPAPTISPQGVFFNLVPPQGSTGQTPVAAVSATSAAGTTTITLAAGHISGYNIARLIEKLELVSKVLNIRISNA